jgi:hypothetical protein
MIRSTDLRIGNLVYHNDEIIEIKSLRPQDDDVNDEISFHSIYGIKLTEEWLVKFRFKKWGRDDIPRTLSYEMDWIRIFPSNSFCDFKGYGFMYYKPNENETTESAIVIIKYVHQLQNLYYALTGQELEMK